MILIVAPEHEAGAVLAVRRPSHVIDLASPGAPAAPDGEARRLSLRFNDIAGPRDGLVPPDAGHVAALLDHAAGWTGERPLLVQCWAGISRSTATAYAIACARAGPGREAALAGRLRALAPFATPNPLIVALADRALGRGGAMARAVHAIGRGAEAPHGRAFDFDLSPFVTERTPR